MFETLNNFQTLLDGWEADDRWSSELAYIKGNDKITMQAILSGAIADYGEDAVAERLDAHAAEIASIIERVLYSSGSKYHDNGRDGVQEDFKRLREILLSRPLRFDVNI